ncbi:MAG: two-component system sensor histidine kinase KdbD [Nitrosomonadales bacterium SCN 54-20]|nr:MAG: two-component system sensor histidine kinase KdbD [Nitrosomonadales bacterium SCN 54-20]
MINQRPDPDKLLEKIQQEQAKERRGRLKIFFGGCAGVGKTYAMLSAAQELRRQATDVTVGIAETHNRGETEKLLDGLEVLPRRHVVYQGHALTEFDLDGALKRNPALILVDELAHTNVPGSRHPKRWQDVEELLSSGISVYTTLNVQHLESLNDVVGRITGVRVRETLPDKVFEQADEVTLVDLPADELLRRLREGKVYLTPQIEQARKNFFRKGNLIALRELALRRTADRVDTQMREYRLDQAIPQVWQANNRLMVCVEPGNEAEQVVRGAALLASSLRADWLAVYVETPALQKLDAAQRSAILKTLRLAQDLGAETVTLSGVSIGQTLIAYARSRNVSRLVIGSPRRSLITRLLKPTVADELVHATDIDLYFIGRSTQPPSSEASQRGREMAAVSTVSQAAKVFRRHGYMWAVAVTGLTTVLASFLVHRFDLSNVAMLYLLGVILVSARFGRGPGALSSLLGVLAFDFFFVSPVLSFSVSDTQYILTFIVMMTVSLVISNLTSSLRYQARVATYREERIRALYDLGKELAAALSPSQIIEISINHLAVVFQCKGVILLPDNHDRVKVMGSEGNGDLLESMDPSIAQWVYEHSEEAGLGTHTLPSSRAMYLPLKAPMRTRGILAMVPENPAAISLPEQRRLLDTFVSQIALAFERVHYVEVAQDALLTMESERLRNSLLSAISHDLRTPLTAITGIVSSLKEQEQDKGGERHPELIDALYEQSYRMNSLVTNLLDMARLHTGQLQLNKQWHMLEEVVGSAIRAMQYALKQHHVQVHLPSDLPLLQFDAVLMERVVCNLLENASKYTPAGSHIVISAEKRGDDVWVSVADDGPGLPTGMETRIFDKFMRGEKESAKPGIGLGLSICRAIVEAHEGKIWANNLPVKGAIFTFSLPIGKPPVPPLPEAYLPH